MASHVRFPIWLPAAPAPGVAVFAGLYFIETFSRATMATVIPLQAYELLKNGQVVSFLYTSVGVAGLIAGLLIPLLIRSLARRWVYTLGGLSLIAAAMTFAAYTIPGQAAGMLFRVFGTACLNITLNLYVMDFIRKTEYVRNDTTRLAFSMIAWTIAPYSGVWLYTNYGPGAPFLLSSVWSAILIAVFWYLRMSEGTAIRPATLAPANPLANVARFVAQPRLRLAWLIAFGRSSFWSTFFVYGPILMVASGLGSHAGGILVSAGNAMLITILFWGRAAERLGVRRVAILCFSGMALLLLAAGGLGTTAPLASAGLLLATVAFASGLDAVGNVPFFRAVHYYERPQMTSVFRTYLDAGEMLPPLVYGILLAFFGIGAVFASLSALMIACGATCWWYLHKRL